MTIAERTALRATNSGTSGTYTLTWGTTPTQGDILAVVVAASSNPGTITATGWSLAASTSRSGAANFVSLFVRTAGASEGNVSFTGNFVSWFVVGTGFSSGATTTVDQTATASNTLSVPSIGPTSAQTQSGDLALIGFSGGTANEPFTGYTNSGTAGTTTTAQLLWRELSNANAETASGTNSQSWAGVVATLAPVVVAVGPETYGPPPQEDAAPDDDILVWDEAMPLVDALVQAPTTLAALAATPATVPGEDEIEWHQEYEREDEAMPLVDALVQSPVTTPALAALPSTVPAEDEIEWQEEYEREEERGDWFVVEVAAPATVIEAVLAVAPLGEVEPDLDANDLVDIDIVADIHPWDASYIIGLTTCDSFNAGTAVNDASAGTAPWSNPSNATGPADMVYATATIAAGSTSQYLWVTNFGFAIPADATILSVTDTVARQSTGGTITDGRIQQIVSGALAGNNLATATQWATIDAGENVDYGGSTTLWAAGLTGTTLSDATSGLAIRAQNAAGGAAGTAGVDAVYRTVCYVSGGGTVTVTAILSPTARLSDLDPVEDDADLVEVDLWSTALLPVLDAPPVTLPDIDPDLALEDEREDEAMPLLDPLLQAPTLDPALTATPSTVLDDDQPDLIQEYDLEDEQSTAVDYQVQTPTLAPALAGTPTTVLDDDQHDLEPFDMVEDAAQPVAGILDIPPFPVAELTSAVAAQADVDPDLTQDYDLEDERSEQDDALVQAPTLDAVLAATPTTVRDDDQPEPLQEYDHEDEHMPLVDALVQVPVTVTTIAATPSTVADDDQPDLIQEYDLEDERLPLLTILFTTPTIPDAVLAATAVDQLSDTLDPDEPRDDEHVPADWAAIIALLPSVGSLYGRLLRPDATPLAGVNVTITPTVPVARISTITSEEADPRPITAVTDAAGIWAATVPDATTLTPGPLRSTVRFPTPQPPPSLTTLVPGSAWNPVTGAATAPAWSTITPVTVTGTVVDVAGQSVAGLTVSAVPDAPAGRVLALTADGSTVLATPILTATAADGTFTLALIASAAYTAPPAYIVQVGRTRVRVVIPAGAPVLLSTLL